MHKPTADLTQRRGDSPLAKGSHAVVPSWLLSLLLHGSLLFLVATEVKSCGSPSGVIGGGGGEVGILLKQPAGGSEAAPSAEEPSGPGAAAVEQVSEFTMPPSGPVVDSAPPAEMLLPSMRRAEVTGVGSPSQSTGGALPGGLGGIGTGDGTGIGAGGGPGSGGGGGVRPSGLAAPALGEVAFLGVSDVGERIVFVLDCSASMGVHNAIGVARTELKASLRQLSRNQQFQIIFYNDTPRIMSLRGEGSTRLLPATSVNLNLASQFVEGQSATGGTAHMPALAKALALEPDFVFFLTDADEPKLDSHDFDEIRRLNKSGARIHCIAFGLNADLTELEGNFLAKLARLTGGNYRYHDVTQFARR